MKEKLKVYQTTDNYTPYWTFVNLANYVFQDIEEVKFYDSISGEIAQIDTKHLVARLDVRRAMYLSIDEDYLKYGHIKNDNEFKSFYHLHVEEMKDYLEIGADIPKFNTSYNPKDDYRLMIFALSDSIKIRVFNNEIIDSLILFIENGIPLIEDLNRLAKNKLNSIGSETITDFLNYHLIKYNGDIKKFIKNLIELTNDSWNDDTATNILKRQILKTWKEETKKKYSLKESDIEENSESKNQVIQNSNVFDEMIYLPNTQLEALIELVEVKEKPFWTYNNLAYKFKELGKDKQLRMPKIKIGRFTVSIGSGIKTFIVLHDFFFTARTSSISMPNVENEEVFNRFAIKCFSANYQIRYHSELIEEATGEGWIEDFEIFEFEKYGLYPDPQQLEDCVKIYLSNVSLTIEKTITSFFDFHFINYLGDKKEFIKNCIKITKPVWKEHKLDNIKKRETFALWLEKICKEYDWDSKELEKDTTSKITNVKDDSELDNNMELLTIRELNALSPESYYDRDLGLVPSPLYLNLNNRLESSKDVYYTILKLNEIIKKYWGESKDFGDIKRKNIFNEWLNNIIEEHNLDRSKLGLEPIVTLAPTQPIKKGIPEIELDKESNSIDDTLIIIPLIELVETNVSVFWSYYNYAQLYKRHATRYIENGTRYYRHDNNRIGGSIESLEIKYLKSLKLNIVESFPYDCDNSVELINTGNGYLIGFFSAQHEIRKTQVGDINYYDGNISELIDKIQIQDFETQNLYPNPEHLDLVVKYYLKIIEPTNKSNGQLFTENYIRDFFNFHLNSYLGNPEEFVKHAIKITKEVWEFKNVPNRNREICFNFWLDETIKKYKLDRSKLGLEPVTTPEPPQAQNDLEVTKGKLKVLCNVSTFGYIISELFKKGYIDLPKHNGELSFASSSRLLMQLFDIDTTESSLANSINENKPVLSEIKKGKFSIPDYEDIKPNRK